jgi:lipoate-protein ligase B
MRRLEIIINEEPIDYEVALSQQMLRVQNILDDETSPYVLNFLEHQPVLTTGRTFDSSHLLLSTEHLEKKGVPVIEVSRGGSVTYHGPGQLTVYLHIHLKELGLGLTTLMRDLEQWVIDALNGLGLDSDRMEGKTGVWTSKGKVCAMGIAAKKFVTYHGIGLNICVDRQSFDWIVPCGLTEPVASLDQLIDPPPPISEVRQSLLSHLPHWLASKDQTFT